MSTIHLMVVTRALLQLRGCFIHKVIDKNRMTLELSLAHEFLGNIGLRSCFKPHYYYNNCTV